MITSIEKFEATLHARAALAGLRLTRTCPEDPAWTVIDRKGFMTTVDAEDIEATLANAGAPSWEAA